MREREKAVEKALWDLHVWAMGVYRTHPGIAPPPPLPPQLEKKPNSTPVEEQAALAGGPVKSRLEQKYASLLRMVQESSGIGEPDEEHHLADVRDIAESYHPPEDLSQVPPGVPCILAVWDLLKQANLSHPHLWMVVWERGHSFFTHGMPFIPRGGSE